MSTHAERRRAAIVGVGTTAFGALYRDRDENRSAYDLAGEAFTAALEDSGLEKGAIDGLLTARLGSYAHMADRLGLRRPRVCNGFDGSGRMSAVAVQFAAAAIENGLADTIALVYGNNGRSVRATYGGEYSGTPTSHYDTAFGMTSPGAYVAMMYRRYQHIYGVPDGALAPLAINNRAFAQLNPNAVFQDELTEEMYLESRFIAEPLRLYDYCLINDGGAALIMTTTEIARSLRRPAVVIEGTASCGDFTNFYTSDDFFYQTCRDVSRRVHEQAGTSPSDVDCAQIYDNFTPTVLFSLEGFGFCEQGTSWEWIKDGRIGLEGELPINTSGGHTSESYMQGWALHVEAVRQARGEAGERQVNDCELVQYICAAPVTNSHLFRRL